MKKLILVIVLIITLNSCSSDDKEEPKNCDCDRVAYIVSPDGHFNLPNGSFSTPGEFITINDCSGIQLTKTGFNAKVGECRE